MVMMWTQSVSHHCLLKSWPREEYMRVTNCNWFCLLNIQGFENTQFSWIQQIKNLVDLGDYLDHILNSVQWSVMSSCNVKYKLSIKNWVFKLLHVEEEWNHWILRSRLSYMYRVEHIWNHIALCSELFSDCLIGFVCRDAGGVSS